MRAACSAHHLQGGDRKPLLVGMDVHVAAEHLRVVGRIDHFFGWRLGVFGV
jgi:hypothetical protein